MNYKKLLLTLTLCLCALLCMAVTASASEVPVHSQVHSHPICKGTTCIDPAHASHNDVTFEKAITMADNVLCIDGVKQTPNSNSSDNYEYTLLEGTYYLDDNLTLNKGIQIQGNVTLCLNGHKITCDKFYVIQMLANSRVTFTLCDCIGTGVITHTANSTSNAGGVILGGSNNNTDHSFIMYNGCITGNKISGVYLQNKASFTMYGGSITQNGYNNTYRYGVYGGGVYVHTDATFTMYGGNITGNYADTNGGGVHVGSETANFTMYGGSITGNHTAGSGGGVNVNAGTITVGGNVNISGNWQGNENSSISNNNANNVYLSAYDSSSKFATITIEKALTGENSSIGVTTATPVATTKDASVKIAAGKGTHAITDADKGHFTPDTGYCEVQKKDDGIYLTHVHSGGTATCTAKAKCGGCNAPYGDALGHDFVHHDAQPATCTAKGLEAYDTCSRCDYSTTKVEIPMAAHNYGTPTYVWTNNASCTATRTCTACQHVENETVNTQQTVTQNRSCTLNELSTFTATFANTAFARQIKENVKTADMTGHSYGTPTYVWAANNDSCTATRTCTACQHVENETVNTQKQVTQNRSCTLNELSTFTATFTNTAFAQQTKENVKTADMTGHTYSATEWESNVDNHWHECSACHTQIDKAEHNWKDATYTAPKTCTVCGATQGEPLTRSYYYYAPSAAENKKDSPKTADPGVLLYAGLALASLTGLACTAKKRH